jgi:hypothetical protein
MDNLAKLNLAIGKLLDQINEAIDRKEAPNAIALETLKDLVQLTSLNYRLD